MNSMYPSVMCMKLSTEEFMYIYINSQTFEAWIEFFKKIEDDINDYLTDEKKV